MLAFIRFKQILGINNLLVYCLGIGGVCIIYSLNHCIMVDTLFIDDTKIS